MTPAASWTEADYYTASRAARAAWQATDQQLTIGLDTDPLTPQTVHAVPSREAGTGISVEPATAAPHGCLPPAGSTPTEGADR